MKAVAVVPGTRESVHVQDVPDIQASEGQARVKVLEAGWCGTDAEIHEGLYGRAPEGSSYLILGHENLGVVESSPAGSGFEPGDLVASTVRRACPEGCRPCSQDQQDMCLTGHFLERGIGGLHGFMSEWYVEAPRFLVKLHPSVRRFGVLMEPMSIVQKGIEQAFRIQERMAWDPHTAVVLGAGPVGILAAAALRLRGMDTIVVAREREGTLRTQVLKDAGIRYVSTQTVPIEDLPATLPRIDLVFEATGATQVVFPALRLLGPDGICILSSVTGGQRRLEVDLATWNREMVLGNRLVFGSVNAARRHWEAGARDFEEAEKRLPGWMERIITKRIPFTQVASALQRTEDDIKTVLTFS